MTWQQFARSLSLTGTAVVAVICTSCGNDQRLYPVRGQVLFQNRPAEGATVVFQPVNRDTAGPTPSGTVGADGSFALSTYPHGDGAPPGEYVVLVTWFPPNARELDEPRNQLPNRYASPTDSPLRATVAEGLNELEPFRLAR
jgi:hypothetical protein